MTYRPRYIRFLLWASGALFMAFAVALILGTTYPPSDVLPAIAPSTQPGAASKKVADAAASSHGIPPLREFEPVWSLELQQPLFDGPAGDAGGKRPPFAPKLVGTAMSDDPATPSQAMFMMPSGQMEFKSVGDKVGDGELMEVTSDTATVNYYGDALKLKVEQSGGNN